MRKTRIPEGEFLVSGCGSTSKKPGALCGVFVSGKNARGRNRCVLPKGVPLRERGTAEFRPSGPPPLSLQNATERFHHLPGLFVADGCSARWCGWSCGEQFLDFPPFPRG